MHVGAMLLLRRALSLDFSVLLAAADYFLDTTGKLFDVRCAVCCNTPRTPLQRVANAHVVQA